MKKTQVLAGAQHDGFHISQNSQEIAEHNRGTKVATGESDLGNISPPSGLNQTEEYMALSKSLAQFVLMIGALILLSSVAAKADTVEIVGNSTPSLATATVTCTFNAQTNTFTFTIVNTSQFDARITGIGFDLPPAGNGSGSGLNGFTGNVAYQPAGVDFEFNDTDLGTVPLFNGAVLDFGFITGNSGNFNGGNPNDGLPPGIDVGDEATFVISGAGFAGMTEEQICNAIYVRFQRVGSNGEGSDVGTPGDVTHTPEPASLLLLSSGLFGAAGYARRRLKMRS